MKQVQDKLIKLDKTRVRKINKLIKPLKFAHPSGFRPKKINKESDLLHLYILVGICHQINWNFLMESLDEIRIKTPPKFTPEYLSKITHKELTSWLSAYPKKQRLSKEMKRAALVRDMAKLLIKKYNGKVMNLARKSAGKLGGKNGIYALLSETITYGEDPLKKKATVFIDLAEELGLIKFSDWKNYIPPIDYHMARIFMRCGAVRILNKQLLKKLQAYKPTTKEEDLIIRQACIDAITNMAGKNYKKRKKLQGIFWALGRDCCHEDGPNCENCQLKDCDCKKYIANNCRRTCFLKEACLAFNEDQSFLELREQNFISTWY